MKKIFLSLILFSSAFLHKAVAQNTIYSDFGIWTGVNVDYALNQKWTLGFAEIMRFKENASQLNLFYTDLGAEYKPVKFLKLALIYRSIQKYKKEQYFSFRHRLEFDIKLSHKIGMVTGSFRHRLQTEVRDVYTSNDGAIPEWFSRSKFDFKFDFEKRFVPYASCEFRYVLREPREERIEETWRSRIYLGFDYKFNEYNSLSVYYMIQNDVKLADIQQGDLYIFGLEYNISFARNTSDKEVR